MKEIEAALIGTLIVGRNSDSSVVDNIVENVERMDRARGDKERKRGREGRENI